MRTRIELTESMIEKAVEAALEVRRQPQYSTAGRTWLEVAAAVEAVVPAIAEAALTERLAEHCRECRDELPHGSPTVPAAFILWGKFFEPEAFGPKCYLHAEKHLGHGSMDGIDQHAVFDLRP